jgi:hypothetical protein
MSESVSDWPLHIRFRLFVTRLLKAVGPSYIRAHVHATKHRAEIEKSERCGCFYCLQTFSPAEIQEWIDDGDTAMCPRCGIDSVIGSASGFSLSEKFLGRMHDYWFERGYKIRVSEDAAKKLREL